MDQNSKNIKNLALMLSCMMVFSASQGHSESIGTVSSIAEKGQAISKEAEIFGEKSTVYRACSNYKQGKSKRGNALVTFLDEDFDKNYSTYRKSYEDHIYALGKCLGFNKEQTSAFKDKGENRYLHNAEALMQRASGATVNGHISSEEKFVDGCNAFSQQFLDLAIKKQEALEKGCDE